MKQHLIIYPAGAIKKSALLILDKEFNCECWLQNNVAIKGRAFVGRKGVADIIGFSRDNGRMVQCEIKTINDSLSEDQVELLTKLENAGGLALIAYQDEIRVQVKPFHQVREMIKVTKKKAA